MKENLKQRLQALDEKIEAMRAAENAVGEAAAHSQKAMLYTLMGNLKAAAQEIAKAGALAEGRGKMDVAAKAHFTQGKALAINPGQRQEAEKAFWSAAAQYHALGEQAQEADALRELAALAFVANEAQTAEQHLTKAIQLLDGESEPARLVELYRLRSLCHLAQQDLDAARVDLDQALGVAEESGQEELALEVAVQQQAIATEITSESIASLLQEAQRTGHVPVMGDMQFQLAAQEMGNGRYQAGLELAQQARHAARDATDLFSPLRYLSASLLMAEAHEQLGDRAGVLADLLACKAYLQQTMGIGQQMNLILDALSKRWGETAMQEAVKAYQDRVARQGRVQM